MYTHAIIFSIIIIIVISRFCRLAARQSQATSQRHPESVSFARSAEGTSAEGIMSYMADTDGKTPGMW